MRSDVPLRVWVVETAEEWCLNTLACFPPPEPINGDEALGGSGSDYQHSTEVDVAYDLEWFNNLSLQIGSDSGALPPDTLVNFVSNGAVESMLPEPGWWPSRILRE